MRIPKASSSRSAYLFVTLNLVLLLVFLIGGSSNLRTVQSTVAAYDDLLHEWFLFRLALTDLRNAGDRSVSSLSEYQRFRTQMEETDSSAAIRAAARMSDDLETSVAQTLAAWQTLDAMWSGTADDTNQVPGTVRSPVAVALIDGFQSHLLESQVVLECFVHTEERAISVLLYCLGATIVLVIVVFIIVEVENERARRVALRTQLLAQNTLEIQEKERARIARDLHDSLVQELSLATLETELIAKSINRSEQEATWTSAKLNARLRSAIDWVRTLAYELRPVEIDKVGLVAAISSFCEERAVDNHLSFTWCVQGETQSLSADKAINIYRIAQESVTNAIRHSGATQLNLDLRAGARKIELTVTDNGVGMERNTGRLSGALHGLGIAGMEERARMLGTTLSMESASGRGTTIRLIVSMGKAGNGQEPL